MDRPGNAAGEQLDGTAILRSYRKILVVVDTNMLHDDHFLTSWRTLSLISLGLHDRVSVAIPETVLTEHRKHALQKAAEHVKNVMAVSRFHDVRGDTQRTLGVLTILDAATTIDVLSGEEPRKALHRVDFWHRTAVTALQRGFGFSVPRAGVADLDDIAEAAANRRKPFSEKGTGFNDYVIWTTGVGHALRTGADCVVLATQNTADFSQKRGSGWQHLHPDITQRLPGSLRDSAFVCTDVASLQQALLGKPARPRSNAEFLKSVVRTPGIWESWLARLREAQDAFTAVRCGELAVSFSQVVDHDMMVTAVSFDVPESVTDEHPSQIFSSEWRPFTGGDGRLGCMGMIDGTATVAGLAHMTAGDRGTVVPTWFVNSVKGEYTTEQMILRMNASMTVVAFFDAQTMLCEEVRVLNVYDEAHSVVLGG